MISYNNENTRIQQRIRDGSLPDRPSIGDAYPREECLKQIAQLCDEYGSELCCSMLVAYGHLVGSGDSSDKHAKKTPSDQLPTEASMECIAPSANFTRVETKQ